ncbi:hypothetical protein R9X49_07810 [Pectobacterium carotovorum]|uniref:NACHT domain-containing protein n=1 Tax=Pectobacterium carotovorum TaxID=554 RepID=UPI0029D74BF1|nr:hypothetical protein [Pectobacterium carotovorum]MDX6915013.1 hypothetical protein [Pectobacterium carotovorum]
MTDKSVPLMRYFSLVPKSETDSDEKELNSLWIDRKRIGWQELEEEYRCVILAEAGAGKSFEMEARAKHVEQSGRAAFFIRIEDIEDGFENAFEVGCVHSFEHWLDSHEQAWFFLDSIDEARLENPRTFEKAIRRFATKIKPAQQRAHVFVSSRPYAWRARSDRELLERYLPCDRLTMEDTTRIESRSSEIDIDESVEPQSALQVYLLDPLDDSGIRIFAEHRGTPQVDKLLIDLQRANLISMAARPFDLEGILAKWKTDQKLDGRLELLRHNIALCLDEIDPSRTQRQPLNREKAMVGVRLLAAAVILTGEPGIRIPDSTLSNKGIDAATVLGDWEPAEVQALLERGIFNDALYGIVRFRHREVRELLAAEWFSHQLRSGHSRHAIESLFIREQYGHSVITPRLRPILPWLILFDDAMRHKALKIAPEVAVEGGDAAHLPFTVRQAILTEIVTRIAEDRDERSVGDNSAIARIAHSDLIKDVLSLITEHRNNDNAIYFLGRLVWQGDMTACVPALTDIAVDSARGIYARIASARAVMTCGMCSQKDHLWDQLNTHPDTLPRRLLAEVLENADSNMLSVERLLMSIDKLEAYERSNITGLCRALHGFIKRFPLDGAAPRLLVALISGLNGYLNRKPYIARGECHVSKEFTWLLSPATHAVERLASIHSEDVLSSDSLAIMLTVPAVRFWRGEGFDEYKTLLHEIVPTWKVLNDALFWQSIEEVRERRDTKKSERVIDDFSVQWLGHFWTFGTDRFGDVLGFVATRDFLDDKLVAVSLAYRLYKLADEPEDWLNKLKRVTEGQVELKEHLDTFLNPLRSQAVTEWEEKESRRQAKWEKEERNRNRVEWIERLKATPDVIRNPPGLNPGEFSNDQYHLLDEIEGNGSRSDGANWVKLIPEFGEDVARAYRDAAVSYWRKFSPTLRSEGGDTNSVAYHLIFAMAGLEIEARENNSFPENLTEAEVHHALRYIVWELNGFPNWLERVYRIYPKLVLETVLTELYWELAHTTVDQSIHYILHDLVYYAPWLHKCLVPSILNWMKQYDIQNPDALRYCIHILMSDNTHCDAVSDLAQLKIASNLTNEQLATWYAVWVDLDASKAIADFEKWLISLPSKEASKAAQLFITKLMGSRYSCNMGASHGDSLSVMHLKVLYVLMHTYIRVQDDIERVSGVAYSPGLRDDAQDGRNALFNKLSSIPGKETYVALIELSREHPVVKSRSWMERLAYKRAEEDTDLEPWSAQQVRDFSQYQMRTPTTHRQLFDLTVDRLIDLKAWIENGNDSPYKTWQRVEGETEMRNLVAGWLSNHSSGRYTCAQENELPNSQRPDIWTQHVLIPSPVPIELKLLDNWTGPQLCERLRNQLAGDYLREHTAGCGVMLLVWKGQSNKEHWQIGEQRIMLSGLKDALKSYWDSVASNFPSVVAIDVILIDLTVRDAKSKD